MTQLAYIRKANDINCILSVPAKEHRVNLYDYKPSAYGLKMPQGSPYNLGDYLGRIVVDFMLSKQGKDIDKEIPVKKHLYTIGSNIFGSGGKGNYQDATIWGSGIIRDPLKRESFFQRLSHRKLDIRAVRGPLTQKILEEFGHTCPSVFGDPAILMPLIYPSKIEKKRKYSVVAQFLSESSFRKSHPDEYIISMNTEDYKSVIDDIVSSELIYTSSLHGIILSEVYGVPAVYFRGSKKTTNFKFMDYYLSTGREVVPIAESFEEALTLLPPPIPDFQKLQEGLLESFPYDLWD